MLANLRALFGVIVDIVLLRRGPESLPASATLLVFAVALQFAVSALMWSMAPLVPENLVARLLIGTTVSLLCFRTALILAKKRERFLQTTTAAFGTSVLFAPALIPLAAAMLPYLQKMDKSLPPPFAISLLGLGLGIWLLVVQARIVRLAFEWPWFAAIVFILAPEIIGAVVYSILFGVPQAAG